MIDKRDDGVDILEELQTFRSKVDEISSALREARENLEGIECDVDDLAGSIFDLLHDLDPEPEE